MENEERQTTEVQTTQQPEGGERQVVTTKHSSKADGAVIAQRIIWYIAGFIITLLVLRFVLLLLAANQENAFVNFIYAVSEFFAWPFFGIFSYEPAYGEFVFETSTIIAVAVYALVAWGLAKAFTLTGRQG